eukprot:3638101-Rhodomonas_salina.2
MGVPGLHPIQGERGVRPSTPRSRPMLPWWQGVPGTASEHEPTYSVVAPVPSEEEPENFSLQLLLSHTDTVGRSTLDCKFTSPRNQSNTACYSANTGVQSLVTVTVAAVQEGIAVWSLGRHAVLGSQSMQANVINMSVDVRSVMRGNTTHAWKGTQGSATAAPVSSRDREAAGEKGREAEGERERDKFV